MRPKLIYLDTNFRLVSELGISNLFGMDQRWSYNFLKLLVSTVTGVTCFYIPVSYSLSGDLELRELYWMDPPLSVPSPNLKMYVWWSGLVPLTTFSTARARSWWSWARPALSWSTLTATHLFSSTSSEEEQQLLVSAF